MVDFPANHVWLPEGIPCIHLQFRKKTHFTSSDLRRNNFLSLFLTSHLEVHMAYISWHSILAFYLTCYSDTLSGSILNCYSAILSGVLYVSILAFFLAFYLAVYLTFYSGILSDILFWHSIWIYSELLLCHSIRYSSCVYSGIHSGFLSGILSDSLSDILFWHSIWHLFWHSLWHGHCRTSTASARSQWELAVEVRQCPLTSGARSWGPAVPAAIWSSWLRRGWGPAVPTAIWSLQLRSGSAHCDLEFAVRGRKEARKEGGKEGSNSDKI